MSVADTERALLEELAVLPDPQERLAHVMRRAGRRPEVPEEDRVDAALVPGCVSRVWLVGSMEDGRCHFRVAADSPMVLGLIRLLCDVYEGAAPSEIEAVETEVVARSGLDRTLSPTRLQGLAHARARLRQLAAGWMAQTASAQSGTQLFDAHNHLHDERLKPYRKEIVVALGALDLAGAVVNGTEEADWPAVAALADAWPWVVPSYGLHPWHAAGRSPQWLQTLTGHLDREAARGRRHGVGEIGLDRWKKPYDFADQQEVFLEQLALAAARNLPASLHCLEAWGTLDALLHQYPVPARGFLLHAYGGPAELVPRLAARGAYFSFNGYFLHERKGAQRDVFRQVPAERLLVETDAPAMPPPPALTRHILPRSPDGVPLNHPASVADVYPALAVLRGLREPELAALVEANFRRLFDS